MLCHILSSSTVVCYQDLELPYKVLSRKRTLLILQCGVALCRKHLEASLPRL